MHLILNPNPIAIVPPVVLWFIEGWNGFTFKPSKNEAIQPFLEKGNPRTTWRDRVLVDEAWRIALKIDDAITAKYGSLSVAIDTWVEIGYVIWVEDTDLIDEQPDDHFDSMPLGHLIGYDDNA
jgi:hypothetical protein